MVEGEDAQIQTFLKYTKYFPEKIISIVHKSTKQPKYAYLSLFALYIFQPKNFYQHINRPRL